MTLGCFFEETGEYVKAKEFLENSLPIAKEIGDRKGEGSAYGYLGDVNLSLGKYTKAKEYFENAHVIAVDIGCRKGEALCYERLGVMFPKTGEYFKAE